MPKKLDQHGVSKEDMEDGREFVHRIYSFVAGVVSLEQLADQVPAEYKLPDLLERMIRAQLIVLGDEGREILDVVAKGECPGCDKCEGSDDSDDPDWQQFKQNGNKNLN